MTIDELLRELDQEAQTTRRVLERVPEDQMGWKPHEKSMSLGVLAMHVALIPAAIAEVAMQDGFDVDTPIPRPQATSVAELTATLERSLATAHSLLAGLDQAGLEKPWRMTKGGRELATMPRGALLRSVMLNHWYHHRGQLTVYLRQTGALVPSVYGGSADEVPGAAR
jgi:uncharacterized damage-inducible protein DinB